MEEKIHWSAKRMLRVPLMQFESLFLDDFSIFNIMLSAFTQFRK